MSSYSIDPNSTEVLVIGMLSDKLVNKYELSCSTNEVYLYPGVIKHLKKRGKDRYSLFLQSHPHLSNIISNPDYVGQNPKEPNSIELYKQLGDHILVAIKLDPRGYLYMSTFYDLHNSSHKIKKRIRSGRIVHYDSI